MVSTYPKLLIHPFHNEHSDFLQLPITNDTSVSILIHSPLCHNEKFPDINPVELLGHRVYLMNDWIAPPLLHGNKRLLITLSQFHQLKRCKLIMYCYFNLHFTNYPWLGTYLHMLVLFLNFLFFKLPNCLLILNRFFSCLFGGIPCLF